MIGPTLLGRRRPVQLAAARRLSWNSRRKRRERTRTGRKNLGRQETQRVPSKDKPPARDEAMNVRMVVQALAPAVQHGDETDLGAEMARIAAIVCSVSAVDLNKMA
jgi:hypothetical protein